MKTKAEIENSFRNLDDDKRKYLKSLFENCPQYVIANTELRKFKKGKEFITAGEPSRNVYFLLQGRARGIEFQSEGDLYMFREFRPGAVLGDFEVFGELDECRVSIYTTSQCEMLVIPAGVYLKWMKQDVHALYLRVRDIMRTLTYQMSDERAMFHLNSKERLILFILAQYPKDRDPQIYKVGMLQREVAEATGITVRTVQRTMKEMESEDLISVKAGKICVTAGQVRKLEKIRDRSLYGME